MNAFVSGLGTVAGFCAHGNEHSGPMTFLLLMSAACSTWNKNPVRQFKRNVLSVA